MAILREIKILSLVALTVIGLILAMHCAVTAFGTAQDGVLAWLKALIYDQDSSTIKVAVQILKTTMFAMLAFLFFILFSTQLSILFLDSPDKLKRAFQWQLYKYGQVFLPLGVFLMVFIMVCTLAVLFFNPLMKISGVDAGIITFIAAFIGMNLFLLLGVSIFLSLKRLIKLSFGTEIAIKYPEFGNKTVLTRAQLCPVRVSIVLVCLVFTMLLAIQSINIQEHSIIAFLALNAASFTGVKYLKTSVFLKSCSI